MQTIKSYVSEVLEALAKTEAKEVTFDIGLLPANGVVYVDDNSPNRIKFTITISGGSGQYVKTS